MLGAVSTSLLNVRSMPTSSGAILGQLTQGMLIKGDGPFDNWLQFNYNDTFGFVSAYYLKPANDLSRLIGTVNANRLNVRKTPSSSAKHLATMSRGASIKTLAVLNDWLEIEFNGETAYVAAQFVDLVYVSQGYYAKVSADTLNVRSAPYVSASLFGQITMDGQIWVEAQQQDWSRIRLNGNRGFVASRYLIPIKNVDVDNKQQDPIALLDH